MTDRLAYFDNRFDPEGPYAAPEQRYDVTGQIGEPGDNSIYYELETGLDDAIETAEIIAENILKDEGARLERASVYEWRDASTDWRVNIRRLDESDDDPRCVCGVHRSEHLLCGCGEWELGG